MIHPINFYMIEMDYCTKKKKTLFEIIEPSSIPIVSSLASMYKAPGSIAPYDHFPGFKYNGLGLQISMFPLYIYTLLWTDWKG